MCFKWIFNLAEYKAQWRGRITKGHKKNEAFLNIYSEKKLISAIIHVKDNKSNFPQVEEGEKVNTRVTHKNVNMNSCEYNSCILIYMGSITRRLSAKMLVLYNFA